MIEKMYNIIIIFFSARRVMWNKSSGVKTFNQRDCQPSYIAGKRSKFDTLNVVFFFTKYVRLFLNRKIPTTYNAYQYIKNTGAAAFVQNCHCIPVIARHLKIAGGVRKFYIFFFR